MGTFCRVPQKSLCAPISPKSDPATGSTTTGSISFGTEERDYFGWLPAEITHAVLESVINDIASMVCHAHRMGRKEAYNFLKQFVLELKRVPDWPHYSMNDLWENGPPSLPPAGWRLPTNFSVRPDFPFTSLESRKPLH